MPKVAKLELSKTKIYDFGLSFQDLESKVKSHKIGLGKY